jgi:3-oxoacyl-[acyl-carrier protein] reductase
MSELLGKTAMVTGATRGIGRAVTERLLAEGAQVVGVYRSADHEAAVLRKQAPDGFHPVKFDVADVAAIEDLVAGLPSPFGRLDILVNNAGIKQHATFFDTSPKVWDETMAVNLRAPYFLARAVVPGMITRGGGRIINIGSQAGPNLSPDSLEYGLSKAGLAHLTKLLARVLAPHNITVNAVSPGRTDTDMTGYDHNPGKRERALAGIPLHHINDPTEIASVVLFLAGAASGNITGQVIGVDGGEVIR